ncbi:MAG: hypothetical protein R3A79_06750 [Nannocystaceae bacterium]
MAISLDLSPAGDGDEHVDVDVRVLPLIDATDYRDLEQIVGRQRVAVRALDRGLQAIWAASAPTRACAATSTASCAR